MARRDGTGPMGQGPMSGRGLGPCGGGGASRFGAGFGAGCRRGFGRGFGWNLPQPSEKAQKELLEGQKDMLKRRLEAIEEQLKDE